MMYGPEAIIHLDRLVHNYRQVSSQVGGRRIMAVVKANAYGHGAVPVARALNTAGVDYFAVFTVPEALELRRGGIEDEILVFSRLEEEFLAAAREQRITLNVAWSDDLDLLEDYYRATGVTLPVHLKVDTGMTRLGVPGEEALGILERMDRSPALNCEGIYSHFATADEGDLSYARHQLDRFNQVLEGARKKGIQFKYIHFSNSGAALNLDQAPFNLVRVGILLYGAYPSDEVPRELDLKPVLDFRGSIVTVREVRANTLVSYGGVYRTDRDTTIGVIQTGFADGFPRPWYEQGYVAYRGRRYKIAGRVCMDQFMVDFEGQVPPVGERVIMLGGEGADAIPAEEISRTIGVTPYMLFTAIGGRTRWKFVESAS